MGTTTMFIKLFSMFPSLNNYEVNFPRWHFMAFQFLNVNALLKYSVLRNVACSLYLIGETERKIREKVFKPEYHIFNAVTFVVA